MLYCVSLLMTQHGHVGGWATRWLSGIPFSSFGWRCNVYTASRRWQGPCLQIIATGKDKGRVEIGTRLNSQWHGIVFMRLASGEKVIIQYVNGKPHGTGVCIRRDGTLTLWTYENGKRKSQTDGWCHNVCLRMCIFECTQCPTHISAFHAHKASLELYSSLLWLSCTRIRTVLHHE